MLGLEFRKQKRRILTIQKKETHLLEYQIIAQD